jgi:hypothetical protein
MVRRSCNPSIVRVTPRDACRALRALHCAGGNVRIELAAARILDAYCQGRLLGVDDVADCSRPSTQNSPGGTRGLAGAAR